MKDTFEVRASEDLYELTRLAATLGHETTGGLLGGEFGYGAFIDNATFLMHPFCWCEKDDCPWCCPCSCPEDAWEYMDADDNPIGFDAWHTGEGFKHGWQVQPVPGRICAVCREGRSPAPNFHHKATGIKVRWYKYIGRGMQMWTGEDDNSDVDPKVWARAIREARASLETP